MAATVMATRAGGQPPPGAPAGGRRPAVVCGVTSGTIKVDGLLDEKEWLKAGRITSFRQVEPLENSPPSERTEVLLLRNRHFLYIGLRCFDSNPSGIRATQLERDALLDPDDRVEIVIDPFRSHRNAYFLQIGPGGSVGDGLVGENGRRFSKPWDGIFHGRARITRQGWQAELAVPTSTIRFDPDRDTWGINFNRHIRRKDEVVRWASPFRSRSLFRISEAGDLHGMKGMEQSLGLSFKPYGIANSSYSRTRGNHTTLDGGADLFLAITPALTAVLTFNTDFAEAEADNRQVNLTRFPLFMPEKRDFFLEAAPNFTFGLHQQDVLPFYSRRIGRDDQGRTLPLYGGKLVGRAGAYGIGLMSMHTRERGAVGERWMHVARLTRSVFRESTIGLVGTLGNPTEGEHNSVTGCDWDLRTSRFLGDKNLAFRGYGLRSETEGRYGRDFAVGAALDYSNEPFSAMVRVEDIQENFNPELGFVHRTRVLRHHTNLAWVGRTDGFLRRWRTALTWYMNYHDRTGDFEDGRLSVTPLEFTFDTGDYLRLSCHMDREELADPFDINEGIMVTPGTYETMLGVFRLETSDKRPFACSLGFDYGDRYSGEFTRYAAGCSLRVSNLLQAFLDYDQRRVRLEEGDFTVRLASLKATLTPLPSLAWNTLIQYDNISDSLGLNTRLRWTPREGNDVFLVFNHGWEASRDHFHREGRNITVKVSWTFQF